MSEENKEVLDETPEGQEVEASTDPKEDYDDIIDDLGKEDKKAEYEKVMKENERLKGAIKSLQEKAARLEGQGTDTSSVESEIQKLRDEMRLERSREIVNSQLASIENEKEREAVRLMYEKRIVKSGDDMTSVQKDLELARRMVRGHKAQKPDVSDLATDMAGGGGGERKAQTSEYADIPPDELKKMIKFRKATGKDTSDLEKLL